IILLSIAMRFKEIPIGVKLIIAILSLYIIYTLIMWTRYLFPLDIIAIIEFAQILAYDVVLGVIIFGLYKGKNWARIITLIGSTFMLFTMAIYSIVGGGDVFETYGYLLIGTVIITLFISTYLFFNKKAKEFFVRS
ncbi:MAG: hypothetical protein AABY07_10375, partial [Nanoarchaeota archaeon]